MTQPSLFADGAATSRPRADSGPRYTPLELARLLRLHPPTPEQTAIISAPVEPLLVVAGAGSGKTETMASRVVWLVANGYAHPDQILGLTFTRKAAGELAHRVRTRLGQLVRRLGRDDALVGEQRGGVGVVGRDLDRLRVGQHALAGQAAQPRPHPLAELAGRLAGEGQPEHLVRLDHPVRHQPDDAGRHRLGLAGAGAGDHQQRLDRGRDDRGLLAGRRRQAQKSGQLGRRVARSRVGTAARRHRFVGEEAGLGHWVSSTT